MTITRAVLLAHLVLLAGPWAPLAAQAPAERTIPGGTVRQGTLSFDGRATAGDFTGTTTSVTGQYAWSGEHTHSPASRTP